MPVRDWASGHSLQGNKAMGHCPILQLEKQRTRGVEWLAQEHRARKPVADVTPTSSPLASFESPLPTPIPTPADPL